MARRAAFVLLALSLLFCCACGSRALHHQELTLSLPEDFVDLSAESYAAGYDFLYQNGAVAVAGIRESKAALSALDPELTAEKYAALQMQLNGLPGEPAQKEGLWYFSYEAVSAGASMTYLCAVYEGSQCFWLVQAYCKSGSFPAQEANMWQYLSAITLDN